MKYRITIAALLLCFAAVPLCSAQTAPGPVTTPVLTIPLSTPPQPVSNAAVRVVGDSGNSTYYYWIVSDFLIGDSSPAGPFVAQSAPNTLSATNYDQITFQPILGALTYDVLRTAGPAAPVGACNCAVATAVTVGPVNDQGAALQSFTVSAYNPAAADIRLTNQPTGPAGNKLSVAFGGREKFNFASSGAATFASIASVNIATEFPGLDIGAQINAAIGALPPGANTSGSCGTVYVPAGYYRFTTTIIKPRCVLLKGASDNGTTLLYTPATGTAIAIGDINSAFSGPGGTEFAYTNTYPQGGIADLRVIGSGGSSVGIFLGGDPAGLILPPGYYADHQAIISVAVGGFGTGIEFANNACFTVMSVVTVYSNNIGLTAALSAVNSNENNRIVDSTFISNSGGAIKNASAIDLQVAATSIDFNNSCTPAECASPTPQIANTSLTLLNDHFEDYAGPHIFNEAGDTAVAIFGGNYVADSTAQSTEACMLCVTGDADRLTIIGASFSAAHPFSFMVDFATANGAGSFSWHDLNSANSTNFAALYPSALDAVPTVTVALPQIEAPAIYGGAGSTFTGNFGVKVTTNGNDNWPQLTLYDTNPNDLTPTKEIISGQASLFVLNNAGTKILSLADSGSLSWNGGSQIASSSSVATTSALVGSGALTTTAATSDPVAISWPDSGSRTPGHCSVTPTNSVGASNIATVFIGAKSSNNITVEHQAVSGMTFDVICTVN